MKFVFAFLFDKTDSNLLLGFMPESVGLLIFGIVLLTVTFGLRWFTQEGRKNGEGLKEEEAVHISI